MNNDAKRDEETKLTMDLAKSFMREMFDAEPDWKKAYFRFVMQKFGPGCNASYVVGSKVEFLDMRRHSNFIDEMMENASRLAEVMGKEKMVMLLAINSDYNFRFFYEYENMEKWKITKLDGKTGIPEGF
ncbi:hypothetical protein ACO0LO_05045 [Undibacterium sp. TJN25]|uniref:hypothetical protein n=1 Tax=Undibacterium sp. TJN25 TaxID=3413056 RepID=UPI003BEF7EE3